MAQSLTNVHKINTLFRNCCVALWGKWKTSIFWTLAVRQSSYEGVRLEKSALQALYGVWLQIYK